MDEGHFIPAAKGFDALTKTLSQKFTVPGMKDQYFECYFDTVLCLYKHGQTQKDDKKRAAAIKQAATLITNLETRWPDLGGDASKARFDELLEKEVPLKEQYDQLKGGGK